LKAHKNNPEHYKHTEEWKRKIALGVQKDNVRFKRYGYVFVKSVGHPSGNKYGYIPEHRFVVEKQIGRYLHRWEIVHHIEKRDNNNPKKLMAFNSNSAHMRFHYNPDNVKPEEIIFDGGKL